MEYFGHASDAMSIKLLSLFLNSNSRTYWLFIVASCIVAALLWRPEKQFPLTARERLWSRETWFSRSAINDYGLIMMNSALLSMLYDGIAPDRESLTAFVAHGASTLLPAVPANITAMTVIAPVLLAATLFLVDDLIRYAVHYAEHRIPLLWQFHKVHHSATVLNFMTAERHHPVALIYTGLAIMAGAATVNGLFLALFGDHLTMATLMGGNIFWVLANLLGSAFRHSPVWISFGPKVERWLISPAQHQIHHSEDQRHWDKNMGGTLAIWDRLFGTLYVTTKTRERITYGIGDETPNHASLAGIYTRPIIESVRMLVPVKLAPVA